MTAITCAERVWTFAHPTTACVCRAEYDDGLLVVEVTAGPEGLNPDGWWDEDAIDDAIGETLDDLDKAGLLRAFVASPDAALRELRLIADAADIREIV